jgi:protein associated with RNAse G/E
MATGAETIRVRFSKWNGSPHWEFDMERIGEDEHGVWLWTPAGTELRRGAEKTIHVERGFVKVITPNRWWTAVWNVGPGNGGRSIEIYVDVITPAVWEGDIVRMVDLDLDVIRRRDGTVEIDDEDEFEEHRVTFGYPDHIVDKARTETARLAIAVERRDEPFGSVGERWLEVGREH